MRMSISFTGLDQMDRNLVNYQRQVEHTPYRIAQYFAPQLETYAKENANWVDRTGNARQALYAVAVNVAPGTAIIYLVHGMEYGVFLELKYQGRYAIIARTLAYFHPKIRTFLRGLFSEWRI